MLSGNVATWFSAMMEDDDGCEVDDDDGGKGGRKRGDNKSINTIIIAD